MLKFDRKTLSHKFIDTSICFCGGGGDDGGSDDQPDGITFTGTGGGQGINISADTMSERDARQGDTFNGESSSRFSGSGSQGERDALSEIARAGGNTYAPSNVNARAGGVSGGGDELSQIAQSVAGVPAQEARAQAIAAGTRPVVNMTSSAGGIDRAQPLSLAGDLLARNIAMGVPAYNTTPVNSAPVGTVYEPNFSGESNTPQDPYAEESLANVAADLAMGTYDDAPLMAARQNIAPQPTETYGGYEDDAAYDADLFGIARNAGGKYGLDGNLYGAENSAQIGGFIDDAVRSSKFIGDLPLVGNLIGKALGNDPAEASRNNVRSLLDMGGQFDGEKSRIIAQLPKGTLQMNDFGAVTYSGMPDENYRGQFENLVNPTLNEDPSNENAFPIKKKMTNPLTGEEIDVVDDAPDVGGPIGDFPADADGYVRMTGLDTAPANVPTGFDFDAANRRFQNTYAYRPDYYGRTPMNLTGFTKLL